jgi:hypothetical protein
LTVIDVFTAPACVIRQYADNMLYAVKISLTIGKRWGNGRKCPYTDETPRHSKKPMNPGVFASISRLTIGVFGAWPSASPVKGKRKDGEEAVDIFFARGASKASPGPPEGT